MASGRRHHPGEPVDKRPRVHEKQNQEPKPEKREYLLIVQVDRQHALYRVLVAEVGMPKLPDEEIAHDHLGKIDRVAGGLNRVAVGEVAEHVNAQLMKLLAKKLVHQIELSDRIEYVNKLDEKVGGDQVVAEVDARAAHERFAKEFGLVGERARVFAAARVTRVLVDVVHNVFHDFFFVFEFLN